MKTKDAIIIGSGQGGTPLAKKLAAAGYQTTLIEKRWVGGTCINDGCTPTKTMIADAKMAYLMRNSRRWGIQATGIAVDYPQVLARKNEVVESFRSGSEKSLRNTPNLELVWGEAVFTGHKTLRVPLNDGGEATYTAECIFINTGTRTRLPQLEGLQAVPYLTSTTLLQQEQLPGHLVILGGGYIGLELGQLYKRLGSEVSIIESSNSLLPQEDADIVQCIRSILEEEGIRLYTGVQAEKVTTSTDGGVALALRQQPGSIQGSHLLVASGRTPQTDRLQLAATGVQTAPYGHILVNEFLETNIPGIYALGDVKGGMAFTHVAYNDHMVLAANLPEQRQVSVKNRQVPYCLFTDPQLGRIGLSEQQARKKGLSVKVVSLPMPAVARAIETNRTGGLMKAVVQASDHRILGAAILGEEGGEVMTILQMAMMGGLTADQLQEAVFAHPPYAESINNLFLQLA